MDFNSQQQTALTSNARNLLVLAGAGTGKTRTIIGRVQHLLAKAVAPQRIAVLTFTRRAAAEIRSRLQATAGVDTNKILMGTFHHFCLREMRSRPMWFGCNELTVMDRDDQLQLMRLARGKMVGQSKNAPAANELLTYYSYARNTNQPLREYLEQYTEWHGETLNTIELIFKSYKERKQRNGYFDYDDILHRFAKVMHQDSDICRKIASRYEHVLVDEMQDTNPLQWLILESLAEHANLFCVGDDAQSIYAFRGADFRNVHSFHERLENAQTMKLELNYRSTTEILDLANWLLSESSLEYGKLLRSHRGPGIQPVLCEFDTEFDEAEWIVASIIERHRRGDAWQEHMILCRSGFNARPIEAQLIERKVPYRFVGGIGLLQMAHVRDLLSALRVIVNNRDELAWMRYLTLWPRIGEVTAAKLTEQLRQSADSPAAVSLLKQLLDRSEVVQPLRQALKLVNKPKRAIEQVAKGLEDILAAKYDNWESRVRDFRLLEQLSHSHASLAAFLETYTLDPISATEVQSAEDPQDIVTLITVHSAKGTEAKTCYIAAANPGCYPHTRSMDSQDSIEEERRVLYVAMTRAKDELFISRSLSQGIWSRILECSQRAILSG